MELVQLVDDLGHTLEISDMATNVDSEDQE